MSSTNGHSQEFDAIDLDAALRRADGDRETLELLADVFLREHEQMCEAVHQAVSNRDGDQLRRAAHTLKGSIEVFGAEDAAEAASRLVDIGTHGDFESAADALATLDRRVDTLLQALRKLTDSPTSSG